MLTRGKPGAGEPPAPGKPSFQPRKTEYSSEIVTTLESARLFVASYKLNSIIKLNIIITSCKKPQQFHFTDVLINDVNHDVIEKYE